MQGQKRTDPPAAHPVIGILIADKQGKIQFVNSSIEKLLGIRSADSVGKFFADTLPPYFAERISPIFSNLHLAGETLTAVFPCPNTGNGDRSVRCIGICLERTNEVVVEILEAGEGHVIPRSQLEKVVQMRTEELQRQNEELKKVKQSLELASEEIDAELDMAKKIQQSILPRSLPKVSGYEFAVEYQPSGKVGGDFYNLRMLDKSNIFVLEADVSGHGVPAAFVATIANSFFDRYIRADVSLSKAIREINAEFCRNIKTEHYITAFMAMIHLETGKMRYCRICHPYPILYRKEQNQVEYLKESGGFFIGMTREDGEFVEEETVLNPGDKLLVYTDGLNEGFNTESYQYGRERLAESTLRHSVLPASKFLDKVIEDRDSFMNGQVENDDITALVVGRK